MARYLDYIYPHVSSTLDYEPRKIPVTIHSYTARPGGMVAWAPRRMEIYPSDSRHFAGENRLFFLAIHEQRHVVQVDKMNQGATRALSFLLGEQAHALSIGRMPFWFLEGDAVAAETGLTRWGRGREAAFEMPLRTNFLALEEPYSYDKSMFGSYRDFVPDHYIYGYHMVASLREEYGPELWKNASRYVARNPWHPAPFAKSLRDQTGKNLNELNSSVFKKLGRKWEESLPEATGYTPVISRSDEIYTSYRSPYIKNDSTIISLKSGIAQIEEFVEIDEDKEERVLFKPGVMSSRTFSVSRDRIAWSEFLPHPRWRLQHYSVIKVYDMAGETERAITHRSRLFSPDFAPDGLFLAAVEVTELNEHYIVILDSVTGEEAARYPADEDILSVLEPCYTPCGEAIVAVVTDKSGKGIRKLDLDTGEWTKVLPTKFSNITKPVVHDDMVIFHADFSGKDNIYAVDTDTGNLFRLTKALYGAFDPAVSSCGERIVYCNYTKNGYDLVSADVTDRLDSSIVFPESDENSFGLYKEIAKQEESVIDPRAIPDTSYDSEPFSKFANLFNFHSWSPFYFDYDNLDFSKAPFSPGITLLSQNLLNTANASFGYSHRENNHMLHGKFVYRGWYPVIEAGFEYGGDPQVYKGSGAPDPGPVEGGDLLNLYSVVSIPFNLTVDRYSSGFIPSLRMNYNNSYYHYAREDEYRRGMFTSELRFFGYRYLKQSLRDINPRWGQSFRFRHLASPFEDENLGSITSAELALYFPGIWPHHSLVLRGAFQNQSPKKFLMRSLVEFPRGYQRERTEKLQLARVDYHFPLAYPDFDIPSVLYLKCLRSNIFADIGLNHNRYLENDRIEWRGEELFSLGLQVNADLHIFRLPLPFDIGGRITYVPGRNKTTFSMVFGMDTAFY